MHSQAELGNEQEKKKRAGMQVGTSARFILFYLVSLLRV